MFILIYFLIPTILMAIFALLNRRFKFLTKDDFGYMSYCDEIFIIFGLCFVLWPIFTILISCFLFGKFFFKYLPE